LSLPSSSIPPSLASLPSPAGLAVIAVRPFVVAVFFRSSFFGFSSVAARFFFRRRSVFLPSPLGFSSVAAPVLPPLSRYFCPQPSGLSVLAASSLSRPA
jgi:hypothetical protein